MKSRLQSDACDEKLSLIAEIHGLMQQYKLDVLPEMGDRDAGAEPAQWAVGIARQCQSDVFVFLEALVTCSRVVVRDGFWRPA
ncbi:MAG: hypothetical protein ABIL58_03790 [Pseudomonadota bacterium]